MSEVAFIIEWMTFGASLALLAVLVIFGAQIVIASLRGKVSVLDFVVDERGKLSGDRCWSHVIKGVLAYGALKVVSTVAPSIELLALCAVAVGGHELLKRWQAMRKWR